MFFLLFLLDDRRIRIRIQEAQKHMYPKDPDPQHWFSKKKKSSNSQNCVDEYLHGKMSRYSTSIRKKLKGFSFRSVTGKKGKVQ
jgi:hypothetical protein